jgi:MarR family transcriptional regulator, organic hydroperoxide resistance regulator
MATRASWRLAEALSRADHRVSRRISAALRSEGMSLEQWRVLSLLSDGTGHTMSDIARDVMLPAATLTRVIDRLVEVNLVYRRGDLGDRRRVLVFVSPRGRSLYRKLAGTVDREEAALMAGIRDDDAATLGDLLKRLAEP